MYKSTCFYNDKICPKGTKEAVVKHFKASTDDDADWQPTTNGHWYLHLFTGTELPQGNHVISIGAGNSSLLCNIEPYTFPSSRKRAQLRPVNSPRSRKCIDLKQSAKTLKELNDKDLLKCMRQYAMRKKEKIDIPWKTFAILLVLPYSVYEEGQEEIYNLLDQYGQIAVPTSQCDSHDDVHDCTMIEADSICRTQKRIVHAEAKLMGDPSRHPAQLAVPYDRCSVVRIIEKCRMKKWLNMEAQPDEFKLFLYSEKEICQFCVDAICKSVYVNLQEKYCPKEWHTPVVGQRLTDELEQKLRTYQRQRIDWIKPCLDGEIEE